MLEIPRSSHYQSLQIVVSNREQENQELTKEIDLIYLESKGRYGAPKIHESLLTKWFSLSLKRVQRLMSKSRIRSITKKKYRPIHLKKRLFNWIIC
ncbi:IS3 family transposase [Peribacillus simplex]|uniref:IS3 family transposase n=1 Tax=Peribacillus TaxID=2675229 RepID=UPI001786C0E9|nr:transposase [Brevibacillus sp. JNUCC-41]